MNRIFRIAFGVMIIVSIIMAACTTSAATPSSSATSALATSIPPTTAPTNTPVPTDTAVPTATPAPTDTPAPQAASGDACLNGTWEISDFSEYFASIMVKIKTPFTITGREGSVRLTFGTGGKASMAANNWKVTLSGKVQGVPLTIVISINGAATADYTADDGKITFSNRQNDNMIMSSTVNGQELFSGTSDELSGLFGLSGSDNAFNTFPYECAGNILRYTPPVKNASAVVLERVP